MDNRSGIEQLLQAASIMKTKGNPVQTGSSPLGGPNIPNNLSNFIQISPISTSQNQNNNLETITNIELLKLNNKLHHVRNFGEKLEKF